MDYNMEEIHYNKEAREKLLTGINKANKAVGSTMGPMGNTVIIPDSTTYGKYKVTKDGVSVINSIKLKDPIENIGVEFLRQAANLTVKQAGDGTTTATVLTAAFVNNLKDFNTVDINKAFDEIIPKVLEQLKANSRTLDKKDIKHVASISANNDTAIGEIIQKAYDHANTVKVEESNSLEDYVTYVNGMMLDVTQFSKHFVNNEKNGTTEFIEPNVLILDGKLESLEPFQTCIESAQFEQSPLVIICENVSDVVLRKLEAYVLSGNLYLTIIKSPGFGPFRKELLEDLSLYTGAITVTNINSKVSKSVLGKLQSIKVNPNNTILVKHEDIDITKRVASLKEYLNYPDLTDHQKDLYNRRLEYLNTELSIIKVGGTSELDMKERFDRYDDAVKAVACALEEGIVEGGGMALYKIRFNLLMKYKLLDSVDGKLISTLLIPYKTIFKEDIHGKGQSNMFDKNIIDPLKVTRCALENAVSTAKTILSTEAIVLNEVEWNTNLN
ncbi:MAG TPA: TCP-1/cpn60 chaperonin family protein [Allosphingosinicella sp.]|jgi:chaperonin GroEL